MKLRNREINIFSISMLDMISGAMGAFLIIMIILARYYSSDPTASESVAALREDLRKAVEAIQKMPLQAQAEFSMPLEELMDALGRVQDLKARLDQAKSQIDRLRDDNALLKDDNRHLQSDNQGLRNENAALDDRNASLETRHSFAYQVWWNCPGQEVDIFIEDTRVNDDGARAPVYDPLVDQGTFWSKDAYLDDDDELGSEVWLVRQTQRDTTYKVLYRLGKPAAPGTSCVVQGAVYNWTGVVGVPSVTLSATVPWVLVAVLKDVSADDNFEIEIATPELQERERREVAGRLRTG